MAQELVLRHVAVDAGIVAVGDPAPLLSPQPIAWDAFVDEVGERRNQLGGASAWQVAQTIVATAAGDDYLVHATAHADGTVIELRVDVRATEAQDR